MPAILTRLGIDDSEPDSFDFGTIVIYTVSSFIFRLRARQTDTCTVQQQLPLACLA